MNIDEVAEAERCFPCLQCNACLLLIIFEICSIEG